MTLACHKKTISMPTKKLYHKNQLLLINYNNLITYLIIVLNRVKKGPEILTLRLNIKPGTGDA